MQNLPEFLQTLHKKTKHIKRGKNAAYIPELARVNPNTYGISVMDCDGKLYSAGDHKKKVAIESISKLFSFARVVEKHGMQHMLDKVGVHGSFLPFNSIIATEMAPSHTINPFLNQGAMATTSLLYKKDKSAYFNDIINNMSAYANRKLHVGAKVYHSESETNKKNMALAYLLKSYNRFYGPVDECVDVYTKQCSVKVASDDLATMASVFANYGVHPITKKRHLTCDESIQIMRALRPEGLYEYSDTWAVKTGMPAKSGVGGGILIVVPGVCGIGIVSPPLDKIGNSVRGLIAGEKIVRFLSGDKVCAARNKTRSHKKTRRKTKKFNKTKKTKKHKK
tara:strand:+ start:955 stop:1965 length:1011 start_codon:yes stop_codon:yes gene_type:complete